MTALLWRYGVPAVIGAAVAWTVQDWRLDAVRGERDTALAKAERCEDARRRQQAALDAFQDRCEAEAADAVESALEEYRRRPTPPPAGSVEPEQWNRHWRELLSD